MKKQLIAASLAGAAFLAITAKNADPTLMTVAGKDVPLSEFEYLYHKNNSQQAQPQSIDEYVGMFINYKMKVADAEAAGIDTTAAFREEFTKFRNDLAEPYLQDSTVLNALVEEAYRHKLDDVTVSHIMLRDGQNALIDSLRAVIVGGQATFEDIARQYSIDAHSASRGGFMGAVMPGHFPWPFEKMAYDTAVGEISPVVNSGFGLHLIRVESRTPSQGEVKASHILRSTRNITEAMAERQKEMIDSIYEIVSADPSRFEQIAVELSEDLGSGRHGGGLGWFGHGMMIAEFDSVAFAIPVGAISKPFKTAFGWHIIKKEDARGVGTFDENREEILTTIKHSERGAEPHQVFMQQAAKRFGAHLVPENIAQAAAMTQESGAQLDEAAIAAMRQSTLPVFVVGNSATTLGQLMQNVSPASVQGVENIEQFITDLAVNAMNAAVADMVRDELQRNNPDYRNLVNEYRDGILLYEISNRNVWDRAAKDREGLEAYFQANKDRYQFDRPKYKAYIIFAPTDSLLSEALAYANSLPDDIAPSDLVKNVRERFGRDIKIERVIAAKGENPITDYLGFGEPQPENNNRWKFYAAFKGHIIDQPEEAADVRGTAVTDYQELLEQQWLDDMHRRYKSNVNAKVLKKVK